MSDIVDTEAGGGAAKPVRYHDEGDGTTAMSRAAHLRGWDATDTAWYKLAVDHATGALKVYLVNGGGGGGGGGTVDQGAAGTDPWLVTGRVNQGDPGLIAWPVSATVADGQDSAQGATSDAAWDGSAASTTIIAILKAVYAKVARIPALGQSTKSGSLPVTIASDQGALPVTDNSGSLTVDSPGVPTALGQTTMSASMPVALASNQSALPVTDNSGSLTVDSADGSIVAIGTTTDAASSTTGTVIAHLRKIRDLLAGTITVNASGTAVPVTDNSGSLTIDSPAIPTSAGSKTSAASLGVVLASDQAAIPVTDNSGSLTVDFTQPALVAGTALIGKVYGSDSTDTIYNGTTALTPKFKKITASSSGATEIVALVSSKKIRVLAWSIVCNAAVNVKWQSHTAGDITGLHYFGANGGLQASYCPFGYFETTAGEALDINLSGNVAVGGSLVYVEV